MRARLIPLLGWALLLEAGWGYICRKDPLAASKNCGLPYALSNFQGYFACNATVQIGRPTSAEQLVELVRSFDRVKAVGVGHSWWREQFCAGPNDKAINIVLTELWQTALLQKAPRGSALAQLMPPQDFPVQVDEDARLVRVKGGVTTRVLLDYLADYTTKKESRGWVLPAFPWYLDQTVAGAVATGSHGSSFTYGDFGNQVVSLTLIVANGTRVTVTADSNPHLFKAAKVSVGRLGIIEEVTLPIIPQEAVQRSVREESTEDFAAEVLTVQEAYKAATSPEERQAALAPLDKTQVFYFPSYSKVLRTDYRTVHNASLGAHHVIDNEEYVDSHIDKDGKYRPEGSGAYAQRPNEPLAQQLLLPGLSADMWLMAYQVGITPLIYPGVFSSRKAYVTEADWASKLTSDFDPHDQYELAIPMSRAGTCLQLVGEATRAGDLGQAFRVPSLVRFIAGGDGYIAHNRGAPVMYFNVEDHLSHNTGRPNLPIQKFLRVLHDPPCSGRLHYGKAGWPWLQPCFEGAEAYGEQWCSFGCAVQDKARFTGLPQELDPSGKFQSQSNIWRWSAAGPDGSPADFASCCSPQGFDSRACTCVASPRQGPCPTNLNITDIQPGP